MRHNNHHNKLSKRNDSWANKILSSIKLLLIYYQQCYMHTINIFNHKCHNKQRMDIFVSKSIEHKTSIGME